MLFPVSRMQVQRNSQDLKIIDIRYGIKNQQNVTLCNYGRIIKNTAVCALCCSSCLAPLEWRDMLFGTA